MNNPSLSYMSAYPDVWRSYQSNNRGMTPSQFATTHYNQFGPREQRRSPQQVSQYFQSGGIPDWFLQASMNWKPANQPTNERGIHQNWQQYSQPGYRGVNPTKMHDFGEAYKTELTSRGIYGDAYSDHLKYMNDPDVRLAAMKRAGITQPWKPQSAYLLNNPDVATAYNNNSYGMTPKQFAQTHYDKYGQAEGRDAPSKQWASGDANWQIDWGDNAPPAYISKGYEGVDGPQYLAVNGQKYYGDDQISRIQTMINSPPQYNTVDGPRQMSPDMAALFAKQQAEARPLEELLKAGRPA